MKERKASTIFEETRVKKRAETSQANKTLIDSEDEEFIAKSIEDKATYHGLVMYTNRRVKKRDLLNIANYRLTKKVLQMLNSMPANKAKGADGLSPKLLKIAAPSISSSVAHLINHCISTNTFPSRWKVAKVTPIFKNQGNVEHKQNYRPISVLPILSKLYERHLYESTIFTLIQ
ncbi:Hypothetical predicted protein [Paramuricea clavata]|uniref:Uncharacterized protein n=1 Tax=Paramuricea clavata TaxID=317549 RepID=A0A7D9IEY0_PARCT|nr:Hypothetical predicted protein [Paramuricea clavata]